MASDPFGPDPEPTPCEHGLLVCDECEAAMARDALLLDPADFYQSWMPTPRPLGPEGTGSPAP